MAVSTSNVGKLVLSVTSVVFLYYVLFCFIPFYRLEEGKCYDQVAVTLLNNYFNNFLLITINDLTCSYVIQLKYNLCFHLLSS